MAEIKSTLDIIMEKTKGLTMTDEEKRELKRKEIAGKVKGLIQKFSDGLIDPEGLKMELATLGKGNEDMLRRIIMEEIGGRIKPEGDNKPLLEILEAVTGMNIVPIRKMLIDLERNLEKERAAHEKGLKKRLKKKGISGSAVIPNVDADSQWRDYVSKLNETFRKEVEGLFVSHG
jgi:hypothetical protein